MLVPTAHLLREAQAGQYAIGAFNVYNLEGAQAVIAAAEEAHSPVMLQLLPKAVELGGSPLIALCLKAADEATVPAAVHLDHSPSETAIAAALAEGVSSVMADGSHLSYAENVAFTRQMNALAGSYGGLVEAELGRLSGTEDGLTVAEYEARLTDPEQSGQFVAETGVGALAVCIGNVHGRYLRPPELDFERLAQIGQRVSIPLVLHGTSGLPDGMIRQSIELGVCKFNVNTELRQAYLAAVTDYLAKAAAPELTSMMLAARSAMQGAVAGKLTLFGSGGRA